MFYFSLKLFNVILRLINLKHDSTWLKKIFHFSHWSLTHNFIIRNRAPTYWAKVHLYLLQSLSSLFSYNIVNCSVFFNSSCIFILHCIPNIISVTVRISVVFTCQFPLQLSASRLWSVSQSLNEQLDQVFLISLAISWFETVNTWFS